MKKLFFLLLYLTVSASVAATESIPVTAEASPLLQTKNQDIAFYESRVAAYPDDPDSLRMLAGAFISRAEFTGAAADYQRANEVLEQAELLDPDSLHLLRSRAALLLSRHRFAAARTLAEQGLQKAPDEANLLGIAGDAALETGDFAGAELYYRKLTKDAPELMSSWARLSHLMELRGELDKAAELMGKAIETANKKAPSADSMAWAHAILGEIEAKRGHLDEARKHYNFALVKFPDHLLALEFLADLEQWQGKPEAAETIYRKSLTLKPDAKVKLSLAGLLEQRGKKAEAAQLRTQAHQFYETAVAAGNEGYLRPLATLELQAGHYVRAAQLAARDVELRPTAESRAIYRNIVKAAQAAGKPVKDS